MSNLYTELEVSSKKISDGKWLDVIQYEDGSFARLKLSLMGEENRKYQKALEAAMKPFRRLIQNGGLKDEVAERMVREVFAKNVVLDWENIRDRNNEQMAFCDANVIKLFTDLPRFYRMARDFASSEDNFMAHEREEDSKN